MPQLIAGFIGTAIGLSAVATNVLAFGLTVGAQYLLQGNRKKPKKRTYTAFQSETEMGGSVPRAAGFGIFMTRGHEIRYFKWGSGNKYNASVIQLADGWCDGLEPYVVIRDEIKPLIPQSVVNNEIERYHVEGYNSNIVIRFFDGRPGQEADRELIEHANPQTSWDAGCAGRGVAYVSVTHVFDSSLYTSGIPTIEFILRGLRMYDWRKDGTIPGGEGSHRLDDPSTWEWSENPAVQRFNFELGIRGQASGDVILGMGKPMGALDLSSYTFSANACDQMRTINFQDHKTYICGLRAFADRPHSEAMDAFDNAMAGYGIDRNGLSGVIAGAVQLPAGELMESDIRLDEDFIRQPRRSRSERFNRLSGTFTNPDGLWEVDSYTTIQSDDAVVADKVLLPSSFNLPQVPGAVQAQYVAEIRYRQNRRMEQIRNLPVALKVYFTFEVGDWITFAAKTWLVTAARMDAGWRCYFDLAETAPEIYDEKGLLAPPATRQLLPPVSGPLQLIVEDLKISQTLLKGEDFNRTGRQKPALKFTYAIPQDAGVVAIIFEWRRALSEDVFTLTDTRLEGQKLVTDGVQGGYRYEVRAALEFDPPRTTIFSNWVATLKETDFEKVELEQLRNEITDLYQRSTGRIDRLEGVMLEAMEALQAETADNFLKREVVKKATDNSAAAILEEREARTTAINAEARAREQAIAGIDTQIAEGYSDIQAEVSQDGSSVLISHVARVTTDGDFEQAGLFLHVETEEDGTVASKVLVDADRFIVLSGEERNRIFRIEDNRLVMSLEWRSPNGKLVINPDNPSIEMYA